MKLFGAKIYTTSTLNGKRLRLSVVSGLMIYSVFGILDPYALPDTYKIAWLIRYAVITPVLLLTFILSEKSWVLKQAGHIMFFLTLAGQLGILTMIYFSKPEEPGFYIYYAGLILVVVWAATVYRLQKEYVFVIATTNVVFYALLVVFFQEELLKPDSGLPYFYNNLLFLASASVLSVVGSHFLHQFYENTRKQKIRLEEDKKKLNQARKKAEESDRLKSAFLANMSHEIRTPMNAISGFSSCLTDSEYSSEEKEEFAQMINRSSERLLSLLNSIIDISRIESNNIIFKYELTKPASLITEVFDVFRVMAQKHKISLEKQEKCNEEVFVTIDKERLIQILNNFVNNAIKFTKEGKVELGYYCKDKFVVFYVEDTGIGIAREKHEEIFGRFRQVDESYQKIYQGAGLGLSIAKALAEAMNGKIWLDSEEGKGTTFYVSFPKA
ncbi:MAG TPA: ATP-binding protein, partial [Bacteroidales bacterium]|nr:ATP-binding protein [Bacteroidales bacterium]